jgi:hypothetical protein
VSDLLILPCSFAANPGVSVSRKLSLNIDPFIIQAELLATPEYF